jgi:hypothetical protein
MPTLSTKIEQSSTTAEPGPHIITAGQVKNTSAGESLIDSTISPPEQPTTTTEMKLFDVKSNSSTRPKISFNDDCEVDLLFIIDTSQSVVADFQKQLQFAVDLVCSSFLFCSFYSGSIFRSKEFQTPIFRTVFK